MPDPLDDLRLPATPEAPRPEFTAGLRGRVQAALGLWPDPGAAAGTSDAGTTVTSATVVPYLCVHDGQAALRFYAEAFGAREVMRVQDDDGTVGHAEFVIGGTSFYLADEFPDFGVLSPTTLGGTPVTLHLTVPDVDRVHAAAVRAGATVLSEPTDQNHGNRHSTITDPFGHRWMLSTPLEALTTAEYARRETEWTVTGTEAGPDLSDGRPPVELAYLHLPTGDLERAKRFFGELFAWEFTAGARGDGYGHVANTVQPMGMNEVDDEITVSFRVDDLDAYTERVEQLGGRVLTRRRLPVGENAECEDDQGFRFALHQPAG